MRELRLRVHAAVAQGRDRPLPVQRVRPVSQDERHQQAADQTAETPGEKTYFTVTHAEVLE